MVSFVRYFWKHIIDGVKWGNRWFHFLVMFTRDEKVSSKLFIKKEMSF
jgi:hypothetical protein